MFILDRGWVKQLGVCVHMCMPKVWRVVEWVNICPSMYPPVCLHAWVSIVREHTRNPVIIQNLKIPFPAAPNSAFTVTYHKHTLPPFLSCSPSRPFGRVSPCRQVHTPVAAKVPTCPPYARLRSASLLLPLPTRIQLASPPQICSHSPTLTLPYSIHP